MRFLLALFLFIAGAVHAAPDPNYVYVYKANWWSYSGSCGNAALGATAACMAGSAPSYEITGTSDWSATLLICYYASCGGGGSNRIIEGSCAPTWEATMVDGKQACRKLATDTQCPEGEIRVDGKCVSKCLALGGGSFDLKGTILKGSPALTLCRNNGDG